MKIITANTKRAAALRALLCFGFAVFCFIVVLCTTGVRYRTNDDAAISNIAAGAYGPDTQYLVYVNVILGCLLKPLYMMHAGINWFVVVQVAGALGCFAYLGFVLMRALGFWPGLCAYGVFLAVVGFDFLHVFHYVQYAALFIAVGLVAVVLNMGRAWPAAVLGGVVALMGSMLRFQQFIGIGGLAAALLLWKFWRLGTKQKMRAAALVAGLVVLAVGCKGIDTLVYSKTPGWAEYTRFNAARTQISDFRLQYTDAGAFEQMGYTSLNYDVMYSWNYYDPDVFDVGKVEQIADSLPSGGELGRAAKETAKTGLAMLHGRPAHWLLAGVLAFWLLLGQRKSWPALLGTLGLLAAEVFYLQWRGRLPDTVEFSLVLAAVLFCAVCCGKPAAKARMAGAAVVGAVVLVCCVPSFIGFGAAAADYWPSRTSRAGEFDAAVQDKQTLYLADVHLFDAANGYDVWCPRQAGYFDNIVFTGSWLMYAPPQQRALEAFGVENIYRCSIDRGDIVFLDIVYAEMKQEHMRCYYAPAVCLVQIEEGVNLHKYIATTCPQGEAQEAEAAET